MSTILNAIFQNESLKEDVKILLVKHGHYKEARELMESQNTNTKPFLGITGLSEIEYPIKEKTDKDLLDFINNHFLHSIKPITMYERMFLTPILTFLTPILMLLAVLLVFIACLIV